MDVKERELEEQLDRLDDEFEGFFHWLAGQYDRKTGGFYYARSSRNDTQYTPDIESTAQALNILIRNDLLKKLPVEMRQRMVVFLQQKQDPKTGYFFEENPAMKKDEVMVHRAIHYCTAALRHLGSEPLYSLPLKAEAAPDYVKSIGKYLEKWKSIDLRNSWRGCDLLASSCVYIGQMEKSERTAFFQEAVRFLASIQDPDTGLWGGGSLYVRISGTFKLHTFYRQFQLQMPKTDLIYQSILHCLRTEEARDMCYIRNPIDLLVYANMPIPQNELTEIMDITINNMKKLKRFDGGFSRELGPSPSAPNVAQVKAGEYYPNMPKPVHLSNGLYEGDMNASTQATLIRQQLYKLAKVPIVPLKEAADFFKLISYPGGIE